MEIQVSCLGLHVLLLLTRGEVPIRRLRRRLLSKTSGVRSASAGEMVQRLADHEEELRIMRRSLRDVPGGRKDGREDG